jgi:hypothetical protein
MNERLHDGIERLRTRVRELDADPGTGSKARRIRASTRRSAARSDRERRVAWCARRVRDDRAQRRHRPMMTVQLPLVAITEKGERIVGGAQGEVPDVLGLRAFLQLLKPIEALIDSEVDDGNALSRMMAP